LRNVTNGTLQSGEPQHTFLRKSQQDEQTPAITDAVQHITHRTQLRVVCATLDRKEMEFHHERLLAGY
jgi:hypothetical protein